jgi:hypothetical protein
MRRSVSFATRVTPPTSRAPDEEIAGTALRRQRLCCPGEMKDVLAGGSQVGRVGLLPQRVAVLEDAMH